jgi:putative membrane protein
MQLSVISLNVIYAIIGVVLMFASYRVIDRLTPEVDFPAELQKGNLAVGVVIAAIFISIAMIIGKALG